MPYPSMSRRRRAAAAFCFCLAALTGCVTNPETGEKHLAIIPESTMNEMGAQAFQETLAEEKVSADPRSNAIVGRVADRIAKASGAGFDWEFKLVESGQVNAFCLPGGKIVVYTGILPVCENEASLAFVVGHEVAHAVAQHGNQRMTQGLILSGALEVADLTLSDNQYHDQMLGMLGAGAQVGVILPFSRGHESEADYMGLRYMARAGYDPKVGPDFWRRMGALGKEKPPEFLSTHPSDDRRSSDLAAKLAEAQAIYEKAPVKYGIGEKLR